MKNLNLTHVALGVLVVVIIACLLFGCSLNINEGLEPKIPMVDLQDEDQEEGATMIQKEDAGDMLTAGPGFNMTAQPNPLDTQANVPTPEPFSNYY